MNKTLSEIARELWIAEATKTGIPSPEMYNVSCVASGLFIIDGVAGCNVASGDTADIAVEKAIAAFKKRKAAIFAGKPVAFNEFFS